MDAPDKNNWVEEQNKEVKRWGNMVTRRLKASAAQFVDGKTKSMVTRGQKTGYPHSETKLAESLNRKIYMDSGVAEGLSFKIERHGVFVQKGVGRGYIAQGGSVMRGFRTGKMVKDMAKAKNRSVAEKTVTGGAINRKPVDWFNSILEQAMPEFIHKITTINADAVINEISMKIK